MIVFRLLSAVGILLVGAGAALLVLPGPGLLLLGLGVPVVLVGAIGEVARRRAR